MEEKENINTELKPKKSKHNFSKELEELKKENNELNDKILRLNAEIQNIKRRSDEEIRSLYKYGGEDIVKQILSVVDNFERAIDLDDTKMSDEVSKFLSGFKMIYGNLVNILNENGIKEIDCLNKEFNPTEMDAVFTEKVNDINSNIVIELLQRGYKYNDKVIRPAMVKVSE